MKNGDFGKRRSGDFGKKRSGDGNKMSKDCSKRKSNVNLNISKKLQR